VQEKRVKNRIRKLRRFFSVTYLKQEWGNGQSDRLQARRQSAVPRWKAPRRALTGDRQDEARCQRARGRRNGEKSVRPGQGMRPAHVADAAVNYAQDARSTTAANPFVAARRRGQIGAHGQIRSAAAGRANRDLRWPLMMNQSAPRPPTRWRYYRLTTASCSRRAAFAASSPEGERVAFQNEASG